MYPYRTPYHPKKLDSELDHLNPERHFRSWDTAVWRITINEIYTLIEDHPSFIFVWNQTERHYQQIMKDGEAMLPKIKEAVEKLNSKH